MRALIPALIALPVLIGGCKKAPSEPVVIEGWHQDSEWSVACYHPRDYKASDRVAQNDVREAMLSQWRGERGDGVEFSDKVIERIETALLGKPDAVKGVAWQNLEYCKKFASGEADMQSWQGWISGLGNTLTEGDCKWPPLRYQQHDYLEVDSPWQFEGRVCEGDRVRIEVSALDYYRVSDDGPWINAEGDTSQRALGEKYECTLEDCFVGTVIYRFTGEDGTVTIGAVGTELEFTAPGPGTLHLQVNDDGTWFDNKWRKKGSLIDHAAVAYVGLD